MMKEIPFSSPEETAVVEHVLGERVERPVVTLAGVSWLPRYFDKAIVEREVVPDAVLPRGELFAVIGEAVADEVADAAERQPLVRRLQYGHCDEGDVGVGRLHDPAVLALAVALLLLLWLVEARNFFVLAVTCMDVLRGGLQLAVGEVASRVDLGPGRDLVEVRRRRRWLRREHGRHL